jgi:hypothetical protein
MGLDPVPNLSQTSLLATLGTIRPFVLNLIRRHFMDRRSEKL